jgi:hypothetical protein
MINTDLRMTITFDDNTDAIIYALENIIFFARDNQYIFLGQSVWWISSIIGLQQGLDIHIDSLKEQSNLGKPELQPASSDSRELPRIQQREISDISHIHPSRVSRLGTTNSDYIVSEGDSVSTTETNIHNEVIENCELFLEQSKQERGAIGRKTRQASRIARRKAKNPIKTFGTQTQGIDGSELRRRKAAAECQQCAWPVDRKGSYRTIHCFRRKRTKKGTAPFSIKR